MAKYNLLYLNNPDTLSKVTKAYFTKSQVSSLSKKYYSTATTLVNKCSIDTENINYETDIIKHLPSYLAGLIEGDGYISITNQNRVILGITFNIKDKPLAEKLLKYLGKGFIAIRKTNCIELRISEKKTLIRIVNLINGKFRTPKIDQLFKLIDWLNN